MKKLYTLIFALLAFSYSYAQDSVFLKRTDAVSLGKTVLDFSVPDIPAFKALGIDPSNIMRPSAAKDFAVMFSNFSKGSASVIPKNVAIEVAPALLIKPRYTLADYISKGGLRLLTKTRISLGTDADDETGVNTIAVALRTTLFDKGDFRRDSGFVHRAIFKKMSEVQRLVDDKLTAIIAGYGGPVKYDSLVSEIQRQRNLDSVYDKVLDDYVNNAVAEYKKTHWNASRLDVAYSLVLQSPDSLIGNTKLNKHLLWATWAIRPGNNWAQILLGVNNSTYMANDKWFNEFTGNLRFYAGTNRFKGFLELQYQNIDHPVNDRMETLFTQIGAEANLFRGVWINFSTGIFNALKGDNRSALKSNLNIYLTFPENFRLFRD